MQKFSLFDLDPPTGERQEIGGEAFDTLVAGRGFRLLRIVSTGQATPAGEWYDQDEDEWVVVIVGSAGLRIEGSDAIMELGPGDGVHLSAHVRHRVEWTDPEGPTIWLALHYEAPKG